MRLMKAYWLGMVEFRSSWTHSHSDETLRAAYDKGRDMAHRLTLRCFDS